MTDFNLFDGADPFGPPLTLLGENLTPEQIDQATAARDAFMGLINDPDLQDRDASDIGKGLLANTLFSSALEPSITTLTGYYMGFVAGAAFVELMETDERDDDEYVAAARQLARDGAETYQEGCDFILDGRDPLDPK